MCFALKSTDLDLMSSRNVTMSSFQSILYHKYKMSKILFEPLSDSKVREALGDDVKILKYSELKKYGSIDELLPTVNSFFHLPARRGA